MPAKRTGTPPVASNFRVGSVPVYAPSVAGPEALIKPELLTWARKSAKLSVEEAAKRVKLPLDRVQAWEAGDAAPTIAQLRQLAGLYKRPLAVFFLPAPPKGWDAMHDYRKTQGDQPRTESPALALAIRTAWERREIAVDLADEPTAASFDVTATTKDQPEKVAKAIRAALGVSITEQRGWKDPDAAQSRWRAAVERLDVLVFGFPGVEVAEARGFSIGKNPFPVIGVNSGDPPSAKCFTMMHELAHIATHSSSAVCDVWRDSTDIEKFCNHVAGAVLMPADELLAEPAVKAAPATTRWTDAELTKLARTFSVGKEAMLRRLLIVGKTSAAYYQTKRAEFEDERRKYRASFKGKSGGPSYLATRFSQTGHLYPRLVLEAYRDDRITLSAASGMLEVKTKHLESMLDGPAKRTAS